MQGVALGSGLACAIWPGSLLAGFGEIRSGAGTAHLWENMGSLAMVSLLWSSCSKE